ncbi:MAG: hypothetical protein IPJ38_17885 [Dechloromonas sp.]|uniref:Uncharacterized protein n=1 Tax=Candidatus Dechloromonas phosphorivorans TaxID=2899244 RepID=A0A935MS32_9RHOO|nr:hypothetical protein [Candidatus Dechloromonas phosphorivorans]
MSAYIAMLRKYAEAYAAEELAAKVANPAQSLSKRIVEWTGSLSEIECGKTWGMSEITALFGCAPSVAGPALVAAGWTRERLWVSGGNYSRGWLPPSPDLLLDD